MKYCIYKFCVFFLAVLEFELRASNLLGRRSTTWVTLYIDVLLLGGEWTQGLAHVEQALYHCTSSPTKFWFPMSEKMS
jgi:hypothetical protein